MWQELFVDTSLNLGNGTETGNLANAASISILSFLFAKLR